jgi:hypothetical protein
MLARLVEGCPEEVWTEVRNLYPFWYHVYHVTFFIDFWFRDSYDGSEFRSMVFDERIKPEFEGEVPAGLIISRAEMKEYLERIHKKTDRIFDSLEDERLGVPITEGAEHYTYADVIMGQIRHIMYNLGYLNGILRSDGAPESDWYSYNEE